MGAPCRRRNISMEDLKKRVLKVLSYDPDLSPLQLRQRFGLDYETARKWKEEMGL